MSETTNTEVPATEQAPTDEQQDQKPNDASNDESLRPEGLRALQAEREARKDLERQLKEYEDRDKSDLQKAQEAAQAAESELTQIRVQNLRNEVALAKGVPADLVQFMTGGDEESLSSQADTLLSRLTSPPTSPKPDLTQGASGSDGPKSTADMFAAYMQGKIN